MQVLDSLAGTINFITYFMIVVCIITAGIVFFYKKTGHKLVKKMKKNDRANFTECDTAEYIAIDDIKRGMVIKDNYRTYIAGVKTNGINFHDLTKREQGNVMLNYIGYSNTIDSPVKMVIQASEDDVDCFLSNFDEIKQKRLMEMEELSNEIKELKKNYERVKDDNSAKGIIEREIKKKEKMLLNTEWMLKRNETKRYFIESTTSAIKLDKFESYIFKEYTHDDDAFGYKLSRKEIVDRAEKELWVKLKSVKQGHEACGAECSILSSDEIAQVLRSTFNPLEGSDYKIKDALKSDMFVYAATGTNEETILLEESNDELEEGGRNAV